MKMRFSMLPVLFILPACTLPQLAVPEEKPSYAATLEAVAASQPERLVLPAPPECDRCHVEKSEYRSPFYTLPINFSHRSHSALGIECLFCHPKASSSREIDDDLMPAGHFFGNGGTDDRPDANPCRVCHLYASEFGKKDVKIPGRCETCHRDYPGRKIEPVEGRYMAGLLNNHGVHFDRGIPCLRCHVDFDRLDEPVSRFTPTRKLCEECHSEGAAAKNQGTIDPPRSSLVATAALFRRNCAPCHGEGGKGGGKVAAFFTGDLTPRDLTDASAMGKRTDEQLFDVIYRGGPELMLSERMPAWQGFLSEEEVRGLVRYVRGLSSE